MHLSRTRSLAVALGLGLAVTAVACSDDDDTDAAAGPDAPAAGDEVVVSAEACDAYVALGGGLLGDPSEFGDLMVAFESTAPEALLDEAAQVSATFGAIAEGGDPSAFADPDYQAAAAAIADAYFEGCETAAVLDVDGVDYGFEGLPSQLPAGRVAIRFTNATDHDEPHELVLFRIADGVDDPVEDLLSLPEDEAGQAMAPVGVVFADAPGSEAAAMVDLEPGRYAAICFIPIGGGEDGPPHFTGGMLAELEVA